MSFFNMNIFGIKKTEDKSPSPSMVIQNMKNTLITLEKREAFLEKDINRLKKEAKTYVQTNKQKALCLLKKSKTKEKQLNSIYGQKENLEMQICTLEQGITNQNIISSLKQGKNAMENMVKKLDPDEIGDLMDSISANISDVDDVSNIMAAPIGNVYDDDDLLAELDELDAHIANQELKEIDQIPQASMLPNVPAKPVVVKTDIEKELEELEKMIT